MAISAFNLIKKIFIILDIPFFFSFSFLLLACKQNNSPNYNCIQHASIFRLD